MSTKIQWTDETWNPVVGCSPVSEGCRNCYAAKHAIHLAGNPHPNIGPVYRGTAEMRGTGAGRRAVFTGTVRTLPDRLEAPLRWRKPRRVFVNGMSDLFHDDVPVDFVAQVFAVMARAERHTFQVLTKRPGRMADVLSDRGFWVEVDEYAGDVLPPRQPLPNVWLGTSVEDQAAADERIPHLLRAPAAVRFLSCEPLLGPLSLRWLSAWRRPDGSRTALRHDAKGAFGDEPTSHLDGLREIGWVIAGGESGPGARPCDVAWFRSLRDECREADVSFFLKQLGARPFEGTGMGRHWGELEDAKGGDPEEWPDDLRIREFPTPSTHAEV